jgi:hypothetical protein
LVFGTSGKIFTMRLKEYMDGVEGKDVAGRVWQNRECTQIDANFGECDCPGRGHGPVLESSKTAYASR